jgi:hypothetical protein
MQHDLDQPATVRNYKYPIPSEGRVLDADRVDFPRLEDAIRYVMEQIPPEQRGTASITPETGYLPIEEIERIYRTLEK